MLKIAYIIIQNKYFVSNRGLKIIQNTGNINFLPFFAFFQLSYVKDSFKSISSYFLYSILDACTVFALKMFL